MSETPGISCARAVPRIRGVAFLVVDGERTVHLVAETCSVPNFGKDGLALGLACLEKLGNTGQTLRDVLTRNTARVERTHRKLGAGLADGLRGDDANSGADVNRTAGGQSRSRSTSGKRRALHDRS